MFKIGLYFPNSGIGDVDCSTPHLSNPGIGGTQYCFLLLGYYLLRLFPYDVEVVYYSNKKMRLFDRADNELVVGLSQAIALSENRGNDYFIIPQLTFGEYASLKNVKQSIILWAHNYLFADAANIISSLVCIKSVVFVGKQQYDRYIDHDIIYKSTYIYNMLNDSLGADVRSNPESKNVVYIGALIPSKGFHLLAQIWKSILEECPSAKLQVIGLGSLYSRNEELGTYGLAEKNYENKFISYLSDQDGHIIPSVHFLGILGIEKYDVFQEAAVGVINPSARTETFGMGIIEMNFCQLPVVTLCKNGFPDTIIDGKTGILAKNLSGIKKSIINLLNNAEKRIQMGVEAKEFSKKFAPEDIVNEWMLLFHILQKGSIPYLKPTNYYNNNWKWLRICIRYLRFNLGLRFIPSLISVETFVYKLFNSLRKCR